MAKNKNQIELKEKMQELGLDVDKIELELKKDVKEQLIEDMSKYVDAEVHNKIEKLEKKIIRQKNKKILQKNIIILILLALSIFEGNILYKNGLLIKCSSNESQIKENNNINNQENKNTTESTDESDKLNEQIKKYGYLINNINTNLEDELYLYNNNHNINDLDNSIKLNMAYQLLKEDEIENKDGFITIESDKLKEKYNILFNDEYKIDNFKNNCINYIYNESLNKYLAISIECNKNIDNIKKEIINIEEENNIVKIYTIIGITNDNKIFDTKGNELGIFKDSIMEYKDKLYIYEYEFTKSNDNYYFNSINKLEK